MSGCIPWCGTIDRDGYGRTNRNKLAHRVAYEDARGPIPVGLTIDHLCRNRSCVNVGHMEPVTRKENTLRGIAPPAVNARKTRCKHGHPFDEANTYRVAGRRMCRACNAIAVAAYKARRKSA